MNTSSRSLPLRYGVAVLSSIFFLLLRWPLHPILGDSAAYIQNYPAIMASAWFGGLGPGLLATAIGAAGTALYLLSPALTFGASSSAELLSMAIFLFVGVVISSLNESLHRSRRELEARVEERTTDLTVANGILQDEIRQRKRLDEELRRSSEEIRDLYNQAPCGYHSLDENGIIIRMNDTELDWLGYRREELIGKRAYGDLLAGKTRSAFAEDFAALKRNGQVRDLEYRLTRKDGSTFPVLLSSVAVFDAEGRYLANRTTVYDITDREQAEGLEEANRYKDQFLAVLGHELRSPLGAMTNTIFVLRHRYAGDPQILHPCEVMARQVRHMTRLVDDLRDASRLNRGKFQMERTRLDLREAVSLAVETSHSLIEQRGQSLAVHLPSRPCWVEGDAGRLAQVFMNLLDNAAKYTDAGGQITLTGELNDTHVIVRVRDTGIGLSEEALARVFTLYARAESALTHSEGGLGIGLSLVKGLVEMHGGEVTAASGGPGRGSEFRVSLPLAES